MMHFLHYNVRTSKKVKDRRSMSLVFFAYEAAVCFSGNKQSCVRRIAMNRRMYILAGPDSGDRCCWRDGGPTAVSGASPIFKMISQPVWTGD